MRGIERWAERTAAGETWFAKVEADDGSATTLPKAEYDAQGLSPDFWSLLKQRRSYSNVVSEGMKRVSADFSSRIAPLGFKKAGARRVCVLALARAERRYPADARTKALSATASASTVAQPSGCDSGIPATTDEHSQGALHARSGSAS